MSALKMEHINMIVVNTLRFYYIQSTTYIQGARPSQSLFNIYPTFCVTNIAFPLALLRKCKKPQALFPFLGSFGKLRKATISFVMYVCLAVRPSACNISAPTVRIFIKFHVWLFFENLSGKFKCHYNLTRITELYVKTYVHLWKCLAEFFLEWDTFHIKV
jgi:hypothetical protein